MTCNMTAREGGGDCQGIKVGCVVPASNHVAIRLFIVYYLHLHSPVDQMGRKTSQGCNSGLDLIEGGCSVASILSIRTTSTLVANPCHFRMPLSLGGVHINQLGDVSAHGGGVRLHKCLDGDGSFVVEDKAHMGEHFQRVRLVQVRLEIIVHHADNFKDGEASVLIRVKNAHLSFLSSSHSQTVVRVHIPFLQFPFDSEPPKRLAFFWGKKVFYSKHCGVRRQFFDRQGPLLVAVGDEDSLGLKIMLQRPP
mmetsp:Transcript_16415/g.39278  ORF Transcript_16415/g.39278 Transcript_16415/m.39278 type:complete len:251 (+) Transcript_16415:685-1437(+)